MVAEYDLDLVTDIIIPTTLILSIFVVNGIIFAFIMRQRKRLELMDDEMAYMVESNGKSKDNEPSASGPPIEMQHL